jgi:hypothetical protein
MLYTYIFVPRKNCDAVQSIKYSKQVTCCESAHFHYISPLAPSSGPILLKKKKKKNHTAYSGLHVLKYFQRLSLTHCEARG